MSYAAFCRAREIDPYHPYSSWADEDHAAWYQAKLANFTDKWRALRQDGTTRLMSPDQLRRWVRDSLAALHRPVPSRPWRVCPCHPFAPRRVTDEPVAHGLAYLESFGRRRRPEVPA